MEGDDVSEISGLDAGVEEEVVYDEEAQPVWRNLGER